MRLVKAGRRSAGGIDALVATEIADPPPPRPYPVAFRSTAHEYLSFWCRLRNWDGIAYESVAGNDDDLFDEGLNEGPALGQLALLEEVLHVLGLGGDSLHVVQVRPALGEDRPGVRRRILKTLLPLPVLFDPV